MDQRAFPGGLVVRTARVHCRGRGGGFIPWSGTKILHTMQCGLKIYIFLIKKKVGIGIYITGSLCCATEIKTTL